MTLIDTHTHLDDACFDQDRDSVLQRSDRAGVALMIVPAIRSAGWENLRDLCRQHACLKPAYGLHPMFMSYHREDDIDRLSRWLQKERAVAVGECGLDFYIPDADKQAQQSLFEAQLGLAQSHRLPVIIHARKSVEQVIITLRSFPGLSGVLHSFSGSQQQAERLIEMGFMFGFGGPVTYSNAHKLQALVSWLPLEYLLLETDSPDQPDSLHRRQRNEPAYLPLIADKIGQLKGIDPVAVARQTSANATTLFRLTAS